MTELTLEQIYKKNPWKTLTKFAPIAKKHGYKLPEIKAFLASKVVHDQKSLPPEYLPIFSRVSDSFQFDTLVNRNVDECPYFLVFININTRKGYAYSMQSKNSKSVLGALQQFVSDAHPKVLRSDQDSAYLSDEIRTYLKDNKIAYTTTNDEDHHTLGIINRFIRTIRDLAGAKPLNEKRMRKLLITYNNSTHSGIQKNPNDMDAEDEKQYVEKKIAETDTIMKRRNDYVEGTKVRIKNETKVLGKKRSNVTPQAYSIDSKDGNQYLIRSVDGSIDKVPYYRIVPVKEGTTVKMAKTIKNNKRGIVDRIIGYDARTDKYQVVYSSGERDKIPSKNLREGQPLRLSYMERQYWVKKGNPPLAIKKWV